ncbi:IcmT/TraK family protein [Komagataeibacter kakiaceti]|uniref:IcmT/TraK family protein n=1 Tax=Komagataeibacter kakiaceti TaxID=943261 RepID=UPI001F5A300A|nr:IcmT/TraK family protein [Komagataeibacter kakiaceti]
MWRATAYPVRVFILDARSCFPILISVTHWSLTTLLIGIFGVVFFGTISFFGLTLRPRYAPSDAFSSGRSAPPCRHGKGGGSHERDRSGGDQCRADTASGQNRQAD